MLSPGTFCRRLEPVHDAPQRPHVCLGALDVFIRTPPAPYVTSKNQYRPLLTFVVAKLTRHAKVAEPHLASLDQHVAEF